jgi:metallophosphoesterase (TIGR00282 family)
MFSQPPSWTAPAASVYNGRMRILFIGDIVGRPGRQAVARHLPELRERHKIELVVANAENAAAGLGVTPVLVGELRALGVQVFTMGNHVWRKSEMVKGISGMPDVVRPANFPEGTPGRGSLLFTLPDGRTAGIVNLMGRVFMEPLRCPFLQADLEIAALSRQTKIILVDIHAEASSEKVALGWYLDGRCSAVLGTHTHVQTADEWVLPHGTAYITDAGMCGPHHSVIGMDTNIVIEKFLTAMPRKFEVAGGPVIFSAVLVDADEITGRATAIKRFLLRDS